jgi:hypothetical protein
MRHHGEGPLGGAARTAAAALALIFARLQRAVQRCEGGAWPDGCGARPFLGEFARNEIALGFERPLSRTASPSARNITDLTD